MAGSSSALKIWDLGEGQLPLQMSPSNCSSYMTNVGDFCSIKQLTPCFLQAKEVIALCLFDSHKDVEAVEFGSDSICLDNLVPTIP